MRTSLKKLVTVILIMTVFSCTKEPVKAPQSKSSLQANENATQKTAAHFIGEHFGGGIIFLMNASGTHGLIADTIDLGIFPWWDGGDILTGAAGVTIGKGPSNTRKIVVAQGNTGSYAALACAKSSRKGFTDWFLPSRAELSALYNRKNVVGGFGNFLYWSSSEFDSGAAWSQFFDGGLIFTTGKGVVNGVRAVRAF